MSTHSYLSKCLHRRLHHLGQCCHRMSNAQGEQYHRRHRGHHPGADESPSHKIRSSSCHLPEVSSIGGGRGKYQEGSKASTYQLPSRQARCNHTRFDNHWSFPGSFVDRGRSRKVQGRFKKASTHNLPSHQARCHHARFDRQEVISWTFPRWGAFEESTEKVHKTKRAPIQLGWSRCWCPQWTPCHR